jgi:hypothetical protein
MPTASTGTPTQAVMLRLVYGKFLLSRAAEALKGGGPMAPAVAILSLQDGAELILRSIASHVAADVKPRQDFADVMDSIYRARPAAGHVPQRRGLLDMNNARVGFKHSGNLPQHSDVAAFLQVCERFAREAVPLFLEGLAWDAISLAALVQHQQCQNHLRSAEALLAAGDFEGGLRACAEAFKALFERASSFGFRRHRGSGHRDIGRVEDQAVARALEKLGEDLDDHEEFLRVLLEGVDPLKFRRFRLIIPLAAYSRPVLVGGIGHPHRDEHDLRFCIDFVIETALRGQESWRSLKLFGEEKLPRYRVQHKADIVASHYDPSRVIRQASPGEVLLGYYSNYGTAEYRAILQDDNVAYIPASAVEVIDPGDPAGT